MPLNKYAGWGPLPAPAALPPSAVQNAARALTGAFAVNGPVAALAFALRNASDELTRALHHIDPGAALRLVAGEIDEAREDVVAMLKANDPTPTLASLVHELGPNGTFAYKLDALTRAIEQRPIGVASAPFTVAKRRANPRKSAKKTRRKT